MEPSPNITYASSVEPILKAFATRLRQLRKSAGLTQQELAESAGITAKYVSELENGHANPSLAVIYALSEAGLGVPLATFFGYDAAGDEVRNDLRLAETLLAAMPDTERRRALKVLETLADSAGR